MKATLTVAEFKNGAVALQRLDADYKAGKQKIESRLAQLIEQSNPERIAQNIIIRNSAQTSRVLKEMIGTSRFDEISKAVLREMREGPVARSKFDVDKLKSNLARYDDEILNEVLTGTRHADLQEAVTRLEKMQRPTNALKPSQKFTEGSHTAFLQNITTAGAGVIGFLAALAAGNTGLAVLP